MGLLDSFVCMCPCITRQKAPISPENISHPYPLIPKSRTPHGTSTSTSTSSGRGRHHAESPSFRPVPQMRASTYQPLHSPAPSSSDSTARPSGLGLGIDPGMYSLRPPDRAYLADKERVRDSLRSVSGAGTQGGPDTVAGGGNKGSSRSRRLQKKRIVEGDWELVRRDVDPDGGVSQGWTNVEMDDEEGRNGQIPGRREET